MKIHTYHDANPPVHPSFVQIKAQSPTRTKKGDLSKAQRIKAGGLGSSGEIEGGRMLF
jgi:hypothetical protein